METTNALFELASVSLSCRDRETLLKTFAVRTGTLLGAKAVALWLKNPERGTLVSAAVWADSGSRYGLRAVNGERGKGILEQVLESSKATHLGSNASLLDTLVHLEPNFRAGLTAALYSPIRSVQGSLGIVEVLRSSQAPFTERDFQVLEEAGRLLAQALMNLGDLGRERQAHLFTVERLTSLYDLGRTFTSFLELSELLPIVASKICDLIEADACNLWLVDARSQELYLAQKSGHDPTMEEGARVSASEGLLGEVVQRATPRLLAQPQEEAALGGRRLTADGFAVESWMCAPLRKSDEVLGAVEVFSKNGGKSFTDDDLFFLASISEQAATSLYNARLLETERKASTLAALVNISQEITSTSDLRQILATVANQSARIVNFDRFAIGYFDRGKFVLGAVSGEEQIPPTEEMEGLRDLLAWVGGQTEPISAELGKDSWHIEPESARTRSIPFLEANQYNGFHAIPLYDKQGPVGAIGLLSKYAEFLTSADREILGILAGQTAVATRNSQLYQESLFKGFLQPLTRKKRQVSSNLPQQQTRLYVKRIAMLAAALVVVPWPLRVSTDATIIPAQHRVVSSIEGGVIEKVFVKEGDSVKLGDALAQINDGEDRIKLAQAQAALESARRDLGEAEFRNDPAAAGQAKARADLHLEEVQLEQKRLAEATLHAPLAGIVVTPKLEEKVGTMLKPGEALAEIVEQDNMAAELYVPETDLPLVHAGRGTSLKLNSFPTRTFQGIVERIGVQPHLESGEQYFVVRAKFRNPSGVVKDGMAGRAKIQVGGGWLQSGWYPVGYALIRRPSRWLWMKLWTVLP
jgi:RND family efflux transporter MFP subunit